MASSQIDPLPSSQERPSPQGPRFILASASPRRQQMLRDAGYDFIVEPAEIDESSHPTHLTCPQIAEHLAQQKARAVGQKHMEDVVLAADTLVVFGDQILGKPADDTDARRMLMLLQGTTHIVITAVSVVRELERFARSGRAMSAVKMRFLTPAEIDHYIASKQWEGKAGGYGIQDNDPFVTRLAGSRSNIVGLPMTLARNFLAEAGVHPRRGGGGYEHT